jgi:hypothetical protein
MGRNSHGWPAQVENFSKVKDSCAPDCPMSQSLDDMHVSLPDLKYRPPFLLNLLVA